VTSLLTSEFKLFKDLNEQGCKVHELVKTHVKIFRTYEEQTLVKEVSVTRITHKGRCHGFRLCLHGFWRILRLIQSSLEWLTSQKDAEISAWLQMRHTHRLWTSHVRECKVRIHYKNERKVKVSLDKLRRVYNVHAELHPRAALIGTTIPAEGPVLEGYQVPNRQVDAADANSAVEVCPEEHDHCWTRRKLQVSLLALSRRAAASASQSCIYRSSQQTS